MRDFSAGFTGLLSVRLMEGISAVMGGPVKRETGMSLYAANPELQQHRTPLKESNRLKARIRIRAFSEPKRINYEGNA